MAMTRIARCHQELGNFDLARDMYKQVLAIEPENEVALGGLHDLDGVGGGQKMQTDEGFLSFTTEDAKL